MVDDEQPMSAAEATAFLSRRKQQLEGEAAEYPPEAFAAALELAHQNEVTLIAERDHYRDEWWKTGRLLTALVHDAGGELDIDVSSEKEIGDVMLDFAVSDDARTVTVKLEPVPKESPEVQHEGEA